MDGGGAAYDVVRVQIDSLEDYAAQLQTQISALESTRSRFDPAPSFGGSAFGEAAGLRARHDEVLAIMRETLGQVRSTIATGQRAAQAIAQKYHGTDEFAAVKLKDVEQQLPSSAGK